MAKIIPLLALCPVLFASGGCALGLAAGAGAVAADEYHEAKDCDDDFDPLEKVTGSEDGCN